MSAKLDMSLTDIIAQEPQRGGGRGRGRGRGGRGGRGGRMPPQDATRVPSNPLSRDDEEEAASGPVRRSRPQARAAPYQRRNNANGSSEDQSWAHDKFAAGGSASSTSGRYEAEPKVILTNLDNTMTAAEVKEIFGTQKLPVKTVTLNYDQSGHPNGTAEVSFNSAAEAENAARIMDQAEVDGRPMGVKLVTNYVPQKKVVVKPRADFNYYEEPIPQQQVQPRSFGGRARGRARNPSNRSRGAPRGGFRGGRGGGRRGEKPEKSQAELDRELDSYHGMKIDSTPASSSTAAAAVASQPAPPAAPAAQPAAL